LSGSVGMLSVVASTSASSFIGDLSMEVVGDPSSVNGAQGGT
jgi:hypothetical protein